MISKQTLRGCAALIRADDGLEARECTRMIARLNAEPKPEGQSRSGPLVMQRAEAARVLNRSLRFVDGLARRGLLRRVKLRERKRAIGVRADDVAALVEDYTIEVGVSGKAAT